MRWTILPTSTPPHRSSASGKRASSPRSTGPAASPAYGSLPPAATRCPPSTGRGGRFLFLLNHPLLQTPNSGWIDDHILEEQYWRIGPYLTEDATLEEVEKDVFIPFIHRPMSRYLNALADSGLYLTHLEAPAPPPGFMERAQEYAEAATIPRLLLLRTEKLARAGG